MKIKKALLSCFLCMFVFTGLITAQSAFGAKIEQKVTMIPAKPLTYSEQKLISSLAVKVLKHIVKARGDIYDKNPKTAKTEINQALKLIEIIRAGLPTTKIKDYIWVAKKHLSYENTDEVMPDLVPIYTSLEAVEGFIPIEEVKEHVDKAQEALEDKDKEKAKKELALAAAGLVFVEIDLPLGYTERKVTEAAHFLAKNEAKKADEALKAAEEGVQVISVAIYNPVVLAEKSLWQAAEQYAMGKYKGAVVALNRAKEYLKMAAKKADKKTKEEIDELRGKIDDLEKKLDDLEKKAGKEAKGLKEDMKNAWEKTKGLFHKAVDKFK
ncbi:MAG: YfdX family protein [Desulfobacteraceae bacterium]|nr:YfdX family protein [Desulfobacteraceae bacterium]